MRQTILASGGNGVFTDTSGRTLQAIGNVEFRPGDAVWTDGRCIYGWVRPNQQSRLMEFGLDGVPFLDVSAYPIQAAGVIPSLESPTLAKKLCTIGERTGENFPVLVDGEKHTFLILLQGRKGINLSTGAEWVFPLADSGDNPFSINLLDAMVTSDGDLLTLTTFQPENDYSDGYALTVYRNGEIEKVISPIPGDNHSATEKIVCLIPMAVHLRNDGTFSGTFTEATTYADQNISNLSQSSPPSAIVYFFTPKQIEEERPPQIQSGDISTLIFDLDDGSTVIPFQDAVSLQRHSELYSSGNFFFYDSRTGEKEKIFTVSQSTISDDFFGGYDINGAVGTFHFYEDGDLAGTSVSASNTGFTAARTSPGGWKSFQAYCSYSFPSPSTEISSTQSGTPYQLDVGDAVVNCPATVSQNAGFGGVTWLYTLQSSYRDSGNASCLGYSFNVAEDKIYDVVRLSEKKYLILAATGLYLSDGGNVTKIQNDFAAVQRFVAGGGTLANMRLNKPEKLSPIRANLKKNYT